MVFYPFRWQILNTDGQKNPWKLCNMYIEDWSTGHFKRPTNNTLTVNRSGQNKQFIKNKSIDYYAPKQANENMVYFIKRSTHHFVCMYVLIKGGLHRYIEYLWPKPIYDYWKYR